MMEAKESLPVGGTKLTAGQVVRLVIPFAVILALDMVASRGAFQSFQESWFSQREVGGSVPWYFIGQDLIDVLWSSSCSLAAIAICLAAASRIGAAVWVALSMECLDVAQSICEGVNISLHTSQVWDPARAASTWLSFDSYVQSRSIAGIGAYGVALPLVLLCFLRFARDAKAGRL